MAFQAFGAEFDPGVRIEDANIRFRADGSRDRRFNAGAGAVPLGGLYVEPGHTLAVQPDGKLLVAGSLVDENLTPSFTVRRFLPDGRPDVSLREDLLVGVDAEARSVTAPRLMAETGRRPAWTGG